MKYRLIDIKNLKIYLLIITWVLSSSLLAQEARKNCCICQTGETSSFQNWWFRKGCKKWLKKQSCEAGTSIVSLSENLTKEFKKNCSVGSSLRLGFVGHWKGYKETIEFIDEVLKPTSLENETSIYYENSACRVLDEPGVVQKHLEDVAETLGGLSIEIEGNQSISLGEWDSLLPGKTNLGALVGTSYKKYLIPDCEVFEEKGCVSSSKGKKKKKSNQIQAGQCIDMKERTTRTLLCIRGLWERFDVTRSSFEIKDKSSMRTVYMISHPKFGIGDRSMNYYSEEDFKQAIKRFKKSLRVDEGELVTKVVTQKMVKYEVRVIGLLSRFFNYESYSQYGQKVKTFSSDEHLEDFIESSINRYNQKY